MLPVRLDIKLNTFYVGNLCVEIVLKYILIIKFIE